MPKLTPTWSLLSGDSYFNQFEAEIVTKLAKGESTARIAKDLGGKRSNLTRWLIQRGISRPGDVLVKCALIECNNNFPLKPNKTCCSKEHSRRFHARGHQKGEEHVCLLPECDNIILRTGKIFCEENHWDRHDRRVRDEYYKRLITKNPCCIVCGEYKVCDEHHVEFTKGVGSNKESATLNLCPTHHLAIHRGLAVYDEFGYRLLDETIVEGLISKDPEFIGLEDPRKIKLESPIALDNSLNKCALAECDNTFHTKFSNRNDGRTLYKMACSREHTAKFNSRGNITGCYSECRLPECKEIILFNGIKVFCDNILHAQTHWKRKESGFYERLLNQSPGCEVCGEWRVLDEHHVVFHGRTSDKSSRNVWLCPTHHMSIHRGILNITEDSFEFQDELILKGLELKHTELFKSYIAQSGSNWENCH